MHRSQTQPNIEMYCGILDVYQDDITSFTMTDPETCNVKDRLDGAIMSDLDIKVV